MFKKSSRFSFRHGAPKQKLITPYFVLRYQQSATEPVYGVVCGKVVSKKAVLRNRTKRVFINTLQEFLKTNPSSFDLVFFLRRPFSEYKKSVIIDELQETFAKLNRN
jgi:ribonuclease P protein component